MRGFFDPAAGRNLLWDTKHASDLRGLVDSIPEPARQAQINRILDRFDERVRPRYPQLRAQVVHGDLALDNVLLDDAGLVTGIVDFGDIVHTSLVSDLVAALASVLRGRPAGDVFRSARLMLDGYQSVTPLEPLELELVGDIFLARLATIVTISAWRVLRYPENAEYIQNWDADTWEMIAQCDELGPDAVGQALGAPAPPVPDAELAARRRAALGPAITPPTYARPVHVARGRGAWLFEADGRRILDAYNNVPVVGHCHPRVTEAVVRQTRALNTHSRYLYEPLIELGERIIATMPKGLGLDTVMMVNSGSEANDVAWRIALARTGNTGGIVTDFAYHGITTVISDMSPEEWVPGYRPEYVETLGDLTGAATDAAIAKLGERGIAPALAFLDTGFTSDGFLQPSGPTWATSPGREGGRRPGGGRRGAGGPRPQRPDALVVRELRPRARLRHDGQAHGQRLSGGGARDAQRPRRELRRDHGVLLDVRRQPGGIGGGGGRAGRDRRLPPDRSRRARGRAPEGRARAVRRRPARDHGGARPRPADRRRDGRSRSGPVAMVDAMRENGVLIGVTGPHHNVLKIRPPLVFSDEHIPVFMAALAASLLAADTS